jgi:uncharacterized protein (TIGR03083 family)
MTVTADHDEPDPTAPGHLDAQRALDALRASVSRLHQLCRGLDDAQLRAASSRGGRPVADVLSSLGSGAEIWLREVEDALAGRTPPEGLDRSVRARWDAKTPREKVDDALVDDEALLERFESLGPDERAGVALPAGRRAVPFARAVAMRLNEHALHTWDVEATFDDAARVPEDAAAVMVDDLAAAVRLTGRSVGTVRRVAVRTTHPGRDFTVELTGEGAELTVSPAGTEPDLELPAEAFCRLVHGRLDADHCPTVRGDPDVLEALRLAFPGP